MSKPKITIIGGGPAGLSAAFHLTNAPDWQQHLESVTVYQLGWRLGGKGATGRDASTGWRVEEHGIHGFCSFYFNTWKMMKRAYAELLPESRAKLPAPTLEAAFLPSSFTYAVEQVGDRWLATPGQLPSTPGNPWDVDRPELTQWRIVRRLAEEMIRRGRDGELDDLGFEDLIPANGASAQVMALRQKAERIHAFVRKLHAPIPTFGLHALGGLLTGLLARLADALVDLGPILDAALQAARLEHDASRLRAATTLDLYRALLTGLVEDGLWGDDAELDDVDHLDFRAWLKKHHASDATLESASINAVANILFAYADGDSDGHHALSTASWLSWVLRSLLGTGAYFHFMAAGTGETAILPLYLLLTQRGVKFELFHRLTSARSATDERGNPVMESLEFERQAVTKGGVPYQPLAGPKRNLWPNTPNWDQLVWPDGNPPTADLEAWDVPSPLAAPAPATLRRGAEFDYVVWAIPPSMIPLVGDAALQQRWAPVNEHLRMTATQAVQVWLTDDTNDLGFERPLPPRPPARYASATFPNPLNGMVAFDDLIRFEEWGAQGPRGLLYLCGQLRLDTPAPREDEREAYRERVRANALRSLDLLGCFLTKAVPKDPDPAHLHAIDYQQLYCRPGAIRDGRERILNQYVRANTRPTERYVQASPHGVAGRMDAWDTQYANVAVAGDWIYTGFNIGAFESAVTGGKLAAFALIGTWLAPRDGWDDEIAGYTFKHARARRRVERALDTGAVPMIKGLPRTPP